MYYKLKKLPTELKYLNLSKDAKPRSYDNNPQMYLGRKVVNNHDRHVYSDYNYDHCNWQKHNDSEKTQSKRRHLTNLLFIKNAQILNCLKQQI